MKEKEKSVKKRKEEPQEKAKPAEAKGSKQLSAVKAFCDRMLREYESVIKAMWLIAPEEIAESGSFTLVILYNDVQEVDHITKSKVEVAAMEAEREVREKHGMEIHPSFYLLSDYWDMIRHGSPVAFSEIREGIPVYDPSGFFVPLKKLLLQGKIPGTKENMRQLIAAAPMRINRIKVLFKARVLEQVYTAAVDAGQAALIIYGVAPPAQKEVAAALETHFVLNKLLEPEYVRYCDEIVKYWKDYEHGNIKEIPGKKLDEMLEKVVRLVERMESLMEDLREKGKETDRS